MDQVTLKVSFREFTLTHVTSTQRRGFAVLHFRFWTCITTGGSYVGYFTVICLHSRSNIPRQGNCIFYNLLRPSFVQQWPKPLCSDAFSGWISGDKNSKRLNIEVMKATKALYENLIPTVADEMV